MLEEQRDAIATALQQDLGKVQFQCMLLFSFFPGYISNALATINVSALTCCCYQPAASISRPVATLQIVYCCLSGIEIKSYFELTA